MKCTHWRRAACGLLLLLATCASRFAQAQGERIGLVLGGGGARGAAHIAVLEALERERIPIHAITGTSVGSIVGDPYAAGYSPEKSEKAIGSIGPLQLGYGRSFDGRDAVYLSFGSLLLPNYR